MASFISPGHAAVAKFKKLLLSVSKDLTNEEVEELKFLSDLPKGALEEATTAIKMFTIFSEKDIISETKLDSLIDWLGEIGREDLKSKIKKFRGPIVIQQESSRTLQGQMIFEQHGIQNRQFATNPYDSIQPTTTASPQEETHDQEALALSNYYGPNLNTIYRESEVGQMEDETELKLPCFSQGNGISGWDNTKVEFFPEENAVMHHGHGRHEYSSAADTIEETELKTIVPSQCTQQETEYQGPMARESVEIGGGSGDSIRDAMGEEMQVDGETEYEQGKPECSQEQHPHETQANDGMLHNYAGKEVEGDASDRNDDLFEDGVSDTSDVEDSEEYFDSKENVSSESDSEDELEQKCQDITWRAYQMELAEKPLKGKNCIICSPTGSGKTYTAAYIMNEKRQRNIREGKKFKALFIVNLRNLVLQQRDSLREVFQESGVVQRLPEEFMLSEVIEVYDVIVLTSQIVVNALENKEIKLKDFDMFVFDECHHTDKNHPYQQVMNFYHEEKARDPRAKLPHIMGMTASLGSGPKSEAKSRYINICANLDCLDISHVKKNLAELFHFNPKPTVDQIKPVRRRPQNLFTSCLKLLMAKIEEEAGISACVPSSRGSQPYENWVVKLQEEAEKGDEMRHIFIACRALRDLNTALMIFQEHKGKYVLKRLDKRRYFTPVFQTSIPHHMEKKILGFYTQERHKLEAYSKEEKLEDNKMLKEISKLLKKLVTQDKNAKGILLTKTRLSVNMFMKFFEEEESLSTVIQPGMLIGQQRGTEDQMTEYKQQQTLKRFRRENDEIDSVNLLVATDIAQEGLDMPKCNYVIRYNFVSNEIGTVQSKGRARAKNSECYLIVEQDSVNHRRELDNLEKEHIMMEMLENWDKQEKADILRQIRDCQDEKLKFARLRQNRQCPNAIYAAEKVEIICLECKASLTWGSSIVRKGTHYICTSDAFLQKVTKRLCPEEEVIDLRYDKFIGEVLCRNPKCQSIIGLVIKFKHGSIPEGYSLAKKGVLFKLPNGTKEKCKKWPQAPFVIKEKHILE